MKSNPQVLDDIRRIVHDPEYFPEDPKVSFSFGVNVLLSIKIAVFGQILRNWSNFCLVARPHATLVAVYPTSFVPLGFVGLVKLWRPL